MDFSKTKISLKRPIWDYAKVQHFISYLIRGKKLQLLNKSIEIKTYLNVGCGKNIHSEFLNIDYEWKPGIDLCWDITKGIPLADYSLDGIFTEHCLEHISFTKCFDVLHEFHRKLKTSVLSVN